MLKVNNLCNKPIWQSRLDVSLCYTTEQSGIFLHDYTHRDSSCALVATDIHHQRWHHLKFSQAVDFESAQCKVHFDTCFIVALKMYFKCVISANKGPSWLDLAPLLIFLSMEFLVSRPWHFNLWRNLACTRHFIEMEFWGVLRGAPPSNAPLGAPKNSHFKVPPGGTIHPTPQTFCTKNFQ